MSSRVSCAAEMVLEAEKSHSTRRMMDRMHRITLCAVARNFICIQRYLDRRLTLRQLNTIERAYMVLVDVLNIEYSDVIVQVLRARTAVPYVLCACGWGGV